MVDNKCSSEKVWKYSRDELFSDILSATAKPGKLGLDYCNIRKHLPLNEFEPIASL